MHVLGNRPKAHRHRLVASGWLWEDRLKRCNRRRRRIRGGIVLCGEPWPHQPGEMRGELLPGRDPKRPEQVLRLQAACIATNHELLLEIVPEARQRVYDSRRVVRTIADEGSVFELKSRFGRAIVTALARIEGRTVGFLANNPLHKGGAIDPDACDKAVNFLVLCDSFNIPIISMVDQPGFFIGLEGERKRAPGKIMNWMNALAQITVPRFSVIVRKSFGQAYLNMGGGRNADEVIAWPSADLGFMEPRLAVNVLHGIRAEDDPERFAALAADLDRDTEAWDLAGLYEAQYVIDPRETRSHLARLLEVYEGRQVGEHFLGNWPTTF